MHYVRRFFSDKNGTIVIGQFPNLPILIWGVTIVLRYFDSNASYTTLLNIVGTLALAIWAFLELVSGVNMFRKLLGLCVLSYVFVTLLLR